MAPHIREILLTEVGILRCIRCWLRLGGAKFIQVQAVSCMADGSLLGNMGNPSQEPTEAQELNLTVSLCHLDLAGRPLNADLMY